MSDTSQERPRGRWQFSLRKLLLWTVVVAVFGGIGKVAASPGVYWGFWLWPITGHLFLTGAMVSVAFILRMVRPPMTAWHLTTLAGGFIEEINVAAVHSQNHHEYWLLGLMTGCGMGWLVFLIVEATCRFVDRADHFIGRMTRTASND